MRTKPLVGSKAWFGPRRFGWGLGPVSAEGWGITAAALALGLLGRRHRVRPLQTGAGAALVLVALLKGTSPGGSKARRAFMERRAQLSGS